tara:strand:+ start:4288 stop:5241 length:954 start_codon:yes stop_codon:yes gene_type:complete
MRFTAHIGLGKTGTSAIQFALTSYDGNLGNKRKWPILLDGSSVDHKWLSDPHTSAKTKALYDAIVAHSEKTGCDHVVWSNEAISNNRPAVSLFKELSTWSPDLDVQVILYVREPSRWLKSAWEQWGLSHKTVKGKIFRSPADSSDIRPISFSRWVQEWGRNIYNSWKWWRGIADIRLYKEGEDIINDFCEVTKLDLPRVRAYETPTTSELLSRAIYNNTHSGTVTPHKFDFYNTYGSLDEYSKKYLSLKNIERFAESLKDKSLSFKESSPPEERTISEEDYKRFLDQAIIFSIEAVGRIDQLEDKVKELSKKLYENS